MVGKVNWKRVAFLALLTYFIIKAGSWQEQWEEYFHHSLPSAETCME